MRKIVVFNRISLDGFFTGAKGEIDWFLQDPEIDKAAHEMMQPDTLLTGRVTYQMFESYWPHVAKDSNAPQEARKMGDELNEMTKVVFSKSLKNVSWENSKLVNGDVPQEAGTLKRADGQDIVIFGSGSIVQQLAGEGLIDEYLLVVTPVILGSGRSMFNDIHKMNLKLLKAKGFKSGNALLHYQFVGS